MTGLMKMDRQTWEEIYYLAFVKCFERPEVLQKKTNASNHVQVQAKLIGPLV